MITREDLRLFGLDESSIDVVLAHPHLAGVAVGAFSPDGSLNSYWDGELLEEVTGQTERPKLFRSLAAARRCASRLSAQYGAEVTVFLWVAPEHEWYHLPVGRYQLMTGGRYPTCPRQ